MRFQTIKSKLFFSFFVFFLIACFILLANYWFNNRKDKTHQILITLSELNLSNEKTKNLELNFLIDETINPDFYKYKESEYLKERDRKIKEIRIYLSWLKENTELMSSKTQNQIDTLVALYNNYEVNFKKFVELTELRGFKDFGLEGKMRESIHKLESASKKYNLDLAKLLMIRRHEKDFFLRKEPHYIEDVVKAVEAFEKHIILKIITPAIEKYLITLLNNYRDSFLELIKSEEAIGFTNKTGVRNALITISDQIQREIQQLNDVVIHEVDNLNQQRALVGTLLIVSFVSLIIFLIFYITSILSRPIKKLSDSIHYVVENNFSQSVQVAKIKSKDELGRLSRDFAFMLSKMQESFVEIQNKSQKIEEKQKLLMDSINYAKKIQEAILPENEELNQYFGEYFLIYIPLHTVSGDFYWMNRVGNKIFLAVVDCTGHGVPGAFMSMIGNTLMNKIVKEKQIHQPAQILEELDEEIKIALHQDISKNNDGMDVSLCLIEGLLEGNEKVRITFSGAKNKLFFTQNGEIHKIKGTRRSIGGNISEKNDKSVLFEDHCIELEKGNYLYMGSDGFFDQPDERRKKFGMKKFVKILEDNQSLNLIGQRDKLLEELQNFNPQDHAQRDDITILGVRI